MDGWPPYFEHAASLHFDWVYVNPFHYPGFSGSLYAVKDYYRLNPLFEPRAWPASSDGLSYLRRLCGEAGQAGVKLMMDLVVNHTARDSVPAAEHPDWFVRDARGEICSPSAIDPADARRVTVWGDLGEVDNHHSPDRERLWEYWEKLVTTYTAAGFDGFRCDAAYQVPAALWKRLIDAARAINPRCVFFAETLGCRLPQIVALEDAGFDLIANSSKWWDFSGAWCLEQHGQFRELGPSVSFPETHDTVRLAAETGGLKHVQKQRYLFSAFFSAAVLMPMGYEYGFRKKPDVVLTTPADWEEPLFNICDFVREVNRLKMTLPVLGSEGQVEALWGLDGPVICLRKTWEGQSLLAVINKDWHGSHRAEVPNVVELLGAREYVLHSPPGRSVRLTEGLRHTLAPGEGLLLYPVRAGVPAVTAAARA